MEIHLHSQHPHTPILGVRLGPGNRIQPTDVYDGTSGGWTRAGTSFAGGTIQAGAQTIWVRPIDLSVQARELLLILVSQDHCLTTWGGPRWYIVSQPKSRLDGRVVWRIDHQFAVGELIKYNLVVESEEARETALWKTTDAGRAALNVR